MAMRCDECPRLMGDLASVTGEFLVLQRDSWGYTEGNRQIPDHLQSWLADARRKRYNATQALLDHQKFHKELV